MDITKEQENVETLIGQQVDALLLDAIDPLGAVALVKAAVAAGVPVIEVDAPIDASAEVITTVYNNNTTTAFMVGKYIPQFFADDELISSVVLSGGNGNTGGLNVGREWLQVSSPREWGLAKKKRGRKQQSL